MTRATALRAAALAIAIAGIADPGWQRPVAVHPRVSIAVVRSSSGDWPSADGRPRFEVGMASAVRLAGALSGAADVDVRVAETTRPASVCLPSVPCVIVTDAVTPPRISGETDLRGVVLIDGDRDGDVRVAGAEVNGPQHPAALGEVRARLVNGRPGIESRVVVSDAGVPVGEAAHTWVAGEQDTIVRIPFAPIEGGARRLDVRIESGAGDPVTQNNRTHVGAWMSTQAFRVLVHEPRVSWTTTFIRRALERDPRFDLGVRSRVAPGIDVTAGPTPALSDEALSRTRVVVAGATELLTASDVAALERFVRHRGGVLILAPDQPVTGPVSRLMPAGARESLSTSPVAIGDLKASERLVWPPGTVTALDAGPAGAVVVEHELGFGRVIVSGAMDAWRWRDEGSAFDAYWQGLVAGAVAAAAAPLDMRIVPPAADAGGQATLLVAWRSMQGPPSGLDIAAEVDCGEGATPVRLWPTDAAGGFRGEFEAPRGGQCEVRVSGTDGGEERRESMSVATPASAAPLVDGPAGNVQTVAARLGAPVVAAGQEDAFADRLRPSLTPVEATRSTHPMRSAWWLVPFVLCLAGEWWLRRTRGLR